MQHEITQAGPLLNEEGSLSQKGWAKDLVLRYDRNAIKASGLRIKEWDYYCILQEDFGIALTVADNSYLSLIAVNVFDFIHNKETTDMVLLPFTMGKLNMPSHSAFGDTVVQHKKVQISFRHIEGRRQLDVDFPSFNNRKGITGSISLTPLNKDSMVIATPWKEDPLAFYYNQKINCLAAAGSFTVGNETHVFEPEKALGVLDWGRGVWTYKNRWYWGSASGYVDGQPFGFNIGYGFGDTSAATENMLLYNGVAHKLEDVKFIIHTNDYLQPWKFTSNDGRFELDFQPAIDRYSNTNLLLLQSKQHQVFGYFSGKVILDDGIVLTIDRLLGFAEDVLNRW
ncbi:MAG: DUF2804 domain-containing protein [Sphingobacteriales bacterium]|nr:DUF2804 domain-containing protein [Sphingobacteriales bacterium]